MSRMTMLSATVLSSLFCLGTPMLHEPARQGTAAPQLGQVNFPTSCAREAQPSIETGVALLHSFQYEQADQSFSEAAKRDSRWGLAFWGKALSHYEQLWELPSGKALKFGAEDIRRAQTAGALTERERGYIAAAAAFYLADAKSSETQRVHAYSVALSQLHKQFPDDINAAAFYALSMLALADQQEVDAEAHPNATKEHRGVPHSQFHAFDFLNYSYRQSGQEPKARQLVSELENVPGASRESIAEHQAWLAARNAFELHRWKEAAALPIPRVPRDSQTSTYRVRAIGAARSGDAAAARENLRKFVEISAEEERKSSHHGDRASDKSVRQLEAEAWVAFAEGKADEAVKTLRSAADRQDAAGVDSLAMPAREMLADMLAELKRPSEALAEYQGALKNSPNRFDSLYGVAHAAQMAGHSDAANRS